MAQDHFKTVIEEALKNKAISDPIFQEKLNQENKNIDDCLKYILNTVQESGRKGFTDNEIFGMAFHYYDEKDIEPGSDKEFNYKVVINKEIQLSDEEISKIKQDAIDKVLNDEIKRIHKPKVSKPKQTLPEQQSLF